MLTIVIWIYFKIVILIFILLFQIIFNIGYEGYLFIYCVEVIFVAIFNISFDNGYVHQKYFSAMILLWFEDLHLFWNFHLTNVIYNLVFKPKQFFSSMPFIVFITYFSILLLKLEWMLWYFSFNYLYLMNLNEHFFETLLTMMYFFFVIIPQIVFVTKKMIDKAINIIFLFILILYHIDL